MPEEEVSQRTLEYYEQNAARFWEGTRGHDVSQNIAAMLRHVEARPPLRTLDFGCGPGRDLKALQQAGHEAVGLEGCARFVAMARAYSGCEVLHQDFLHLELPRAHFDAVFANASLFHVPAAEIRQVLANLSACLAPSGVLFSCNPRGRDEEGWQDGRYGAWYRESTWRGIMIAAGFSELEHYYRPEGLPLAQQSWFATIWRRADSAR